MTMSQCLSIEFVIGGGSLTGLCSAIDLARVGYKRYAINRPHGPRVSTFASAPESDHDGGCMVPPNANKVLYRWGLEERLRACSGSLKSNGNTTLVLSSVHTTGRRRFRKKLERSLADTLQGPTPDSRRCATLRFGEAVQSLHPHPERPAVTLQSGERVEADVILGADGRFRPGLVTLVAIMEATEQEEETPTGMQVFQCISRCA
ncbi:hypothetical protein C8Q80DRAFT_318268 [Daedaleopsis nitida]|nr:hypothetical protein C8Q80DRAFT_318268 [Daedaleopsis nitida]